LGEKGEIGEGFLTQTNQGEMGEGEKGIVLKDGIQPNPERMELTGVLNGGDNKDSASIDGGGGYSKKKSIRSLPSQTHSMREAYIGLAKGTGGHPHSPEEKKKEAF